MKHQKPPSPVLSENLKKWKGLAAFLLIFISVSTFAILNHWKIFEQDAFWLTRAGEEILQGKGIQTQDTWTHTIQGKPWRHFQWLTSVVFALWTQAFGGITSLVWLRSLMTAVFFLICAVTIRRSHSESKTLGWTWLSLLLLMPALYLMNWIRFQLRPDLFGISAFAALTLILISGDLTRRKAAMTIAVLLVWNQFHAGTVTMGIALLTFALLFSNGELKTWRERLVWTATAGLTWFAGPQHFHIVHILKETAQVTANPDLQPFSWKLLLFEEGGFSYTLLFAFWIFTTTFFLFNPRSRLPGPYGSKKFLVVATAFFTFMFFMRVRTVPYLSVFLLPIATQAIQARAESFYKRNWQAAISAGIVLVSLLWLFFLPRQKNINVPLGREVAEAWMPVESVAFIQEHRPQGRLYNFFNFGGYLIYALREYPVFFDGRETPFADLDYERKVGAQTPERYAKFLEKYKVNLVLESIPQGDMVKTFARFYPPEEWARVFTDFSSTVYIRRIPEHESIIAKFETTGSSPTNSGKRAQPNFTQKELQDLIRKAEEELKKRNQ